MVKLYNVNPFERVKPKGFEHHLTVLEVARIVNRDRSALARAEKLGRIPKPVRVKVGRLQVRLYSPEEVEKIKEHFVTVKPGRIPTEEAQ